MKLRRERSELEALRLSSIMVCEITLACEASEKGFDKVWEVKLNWITREASDKSFHKL